MAESSDLVRSWDQLFGGNGFLAGKPSQAERSARIRLEHGLIARQGFPGAFAYLGWSDDPCAQVKGSSTPAGPTLERQQEVWGSFAEATLGEGVWMGGLEPDEGFGMAVVDLNATDLQMLNAAEQAGAVLLKVLARARSSLRNGDNLAATIGVGLLTTLRPKVDFGSSCAVSHLLAGPDRVGSLVGCLPAM